MSQLVENDVLVRQAYQEFQNFTADAETREKVRQRQRFLEGQKIFIDAARDEGIEIGVDKGIEIGVDKGIEIGVDKGIEIGEIRGEIKTTLRFRFGELPTDLVKQLSTIGDLETLTKLEKFATQCATLAEFAAGLTGDRP